MNKEQYALMWTRRQQHNAFVWQIPALSIAAQGFLLSQALNPNVSASGATLLSLGSLILGLALIQILARLRYLEFNDAQLMAAFEASRSDDGYSILHGGERINALEPRGLGKYPAVRTWFVVMIGFCLLSTYAIVAASARFFDDSASASGVAAPTSAPTNHL